MAKNKLDGQLLKKLKFFILLCDLDLIIVTNIVGINVHGLVLLILGDKIVQIGMGVGEFCLLHALAREPMQEGLPLEHKGKLCGNAFKDLVDDCAVSEERAGYGQTLRWDVAHRGFDVVRDPIDKVGTIFVLDVQHLVLDFLHRHLTTENCCYRQVSESNREKCI